MSHRPDNIDCPWNLSQPVDPEDMYDVGDCTCKPTVADKLEEIRVRHQATFIVDWFDAEVQPLSLSNAEKCHADRAELLTMIDARDKELEQVKKTSFMAGMDAAIDYPKLHISSVARERLYAEYAGGEA